MQHGILSTSSAASGKPTSTSRCCKACGGYEHYAKSCNSVGGKQLGEKSTLATTATRTSGRRTKPPSTRNDFEEWPDSEVDDSIAEDNPEAYLDPLADSPSDGEEAAGAVQFDGGSDETKLEDILPEPLRVTKSRSSTIVESVLPPSTTILPRAINIPSSCTTASEFLSLLFTEEILGRFVTETNAYAIAKGLKTWKSLSVPELKNFLSLILYMGIVQRPSRSMYWDEGIYGDEFVKSVMTRWRFKQVSSNLHWLNTANVAPAVRTERNKLDGFWTVEEFLLSLSENFKRYYTCGQCINIDEMCIFFKGRHRCRCYNPKKPNKWHLKAYCLNDSSTGYLWDFFMYRGKDERRPNNMPATLFPVTDDRRLHGKRHLLATDNWYTSIEALTEVTKDPKRMEFVGTVKTNSKGLPKAAIMKKTNSSEARGTIKLYKLRDQSVYFTAWRDNKPVHMLPSWKPKSSSAKRNVKEKTGGFVTKQIKIPTNILAYNQAMGGTDKIDQLGSYYDDRKRTIKWQHRVIFHFLRVACINAMVLRNVHQRTGTSELLPFLQDAIAEWSKTGSAQLGRDRDTESLDSDSEASLQQAIPPQQLHPATY